MNRWCFFLLLIFFSNNVIYGSDEDLTESEAESVASIESDQSDNMPFIIHIDNLHNHEITNHQVIDIQEIRFTQPYRCPSCIEIPVITCKRIVRYYCNNPFDLCCHNYIIIPCAELEPLRAKPCLQICMQGVKCCNERGLEPICDKIIIPCLRPICYTLCCQWWDDINIENE
jgi:hypothetical protein